MRANELNSLLVILNYGSLILLSFITLFNPAPNLARKHEILTLHYEWISRS